MVVAVKSSGAWMKVLEAEFLDPRPATAVGPGVFRQRLGKRWQ